MSTIRIRKTIESETLHLPELKAMIGQTVDIIVLGNGSAIPADAPTQWLPDFWEKMSHGWQGEPLVRPPQGVSETRDSLK